MSAFIKPHTITFIVRVWAEYLNEAPPRWRGELNRVGNEQKVHFSQLDEITDFIRKQTMIQINTEDKS